MLRQILLGGLLLPFKIYFQPERFTEEISAMAPELRRKFSLWEARYKWQEPAFRHAILILTAQFSVAMLWAVILSLSLSSLGFRIIWAGVAIGVACSVAGGVALGVALGVARGVAFGIAFGIVYSVTGGVAFGVAVGIAFGVAIGVGGGIAFGVTGGVVGGAMVGVARGVVVGVAAGVIVGVGVGVVAGVARNAAFGVAGGVAVGVGFGTAASLMTSHILVFPVQCFLTSGIWFVSRTAPLSVLRRLWFIFPPRWAEIILPPLPGARQFLITLHRADLGFGREAINQIAKHRYQYRSAHQALAELALEDARQAVTLPALARFEQRLDWLDSETRLPEKEKAPLLLLKEISQTIDAAERSDTLRNRIAQLRAADEKARLARQASGPAGAVLSDWRKLIREAAEQAEEERRRREPIRQVYFNDGAPISPDELPEEESPFKGRMATVRELEGALAGTQRATLLLTGNRRSGKSSLLLQLPRKLGPQVLPAFIDCQSPRLSGSQSADGMLAGLAEEIVEQARRNVIKFRRDPVRFPRLDHEALARDPYPAFARWLEGAEQALGHRQLLLCLDEFEKLEEALEAGRIDGRFLSMLRNIMQHRRRIIVLLAGTHTLDELPPRWADALVTTQSIRIGFLDEADARELIVRPVKSFPEIYTPESVERILALTRSQPYLVQLLCGLLVEKMNLEGREPPESYVGLDDVESVIPRALDRGDAYFNDLWRRQSGGGLAQRILERIAFADGSATPSAQIAALTEDQDALRDTLRLLQRREIIERNDDGYRIAVPLISHYVRKQRPPI